MSGKEGEPSGFAASTVLRTVLACVLAVFLLVGGAANVAAPGQVQEEYARWGYPSWFHFVTGVLEVAAACLLIPVRTRRAGAALAVAVMAAAVATVLLHGEYTHAATPAVVLVAVSLVLRLEGSALRRRRPAG